MSEGLSVRGNMNIEEKYTTIYGHSGFERKELFKAIKENWNVSQIAYVGSGIHITPSFFFKNVTYIDTNNDVAEFFKNKQDLISFVEKNKNYRGKTSIQFLNIDYSKEKLEIKYELVISIFAPGAIDFCVDIMNENGLLIYLPMPSEIRKSKPEKLIQIGKMKYSNKKYQYENISKDSKIEEAKYKYNEKEKYEYFVYRKLH